MQSNGLRGDEMTPNYAEGEPPVERRRRPYVAPEVIFSELFAKGVGKLHFPTAEFHSVSTTSTS
jgi:hypothetical protein